jgi:hypothetical protein
VGFRVTRPPCGRGRVAEACRPAQVRAHGRPGSVPRFTSSDGLDPAEAIFGRLDFGATAKDFGLRGDNVNSLSDFGSLLRNYEAGKGAEGLEHSDLGQGRLDHACRPARPATNGFVRAAILNHRLRAKPDSCTTSGRAFPAVSFMYLSIECPFNKFYGINCHPKLGAKLLDRFLHRRRQVSPPVNNLTHRFFDGSQHFFYCNFAVGSCHSVVASSSSR